MLTGRGPPPACGQSFPPAEYEARRNAIFSAGSVDDYQDAGAGGRHPMPAHPRWGQGFESLPDQGSLGPRDPTALGRGAPSSAPQPPVAPQPQDGAHRSMCSHLQVRVALGRVGPTPPPGLRPINTPPQEYSGIASALERLAPLLSDADTARNLRWQREVDGNKTKVAIWKLEATGTSGVQFYAYMQPGEAFLVVGHSLSTIYSTTTDAASYHGKMVLFIRDRTSTRECTPPSSYRHCPLSSRSNVRSVRTSPSWQIGTRTTATNMGIIGIRRPLTGVESNIMSQSFWPCLCGRSSSVRSSTDPSCPTSCLHPSSGTWRATRPP